MGQEIGSQEMSIEDVESEAASRRADETSEDVLVRGAAGGALQGMALVAGHQGDTGKSYKRPAPPGRIETEGSLVGSRRSSLAPSNLTQGVATPSAGLGNVFRSAS